MFKTYEERWPGVWRGAGWIAAAGVLTGLQWLGDQLVAFLGWPLPGSLAGLLMLLGLLALRGAVPQPLEDVASPLLKHLMLFLIPSIAAVGLYGHLLLEHMVLFVLTATLGTVFTIALTGWVLRRLMKGRQP